jgi:predicted transcriptional regulator
MDDKFIVKKNADENIVTSIRIDKDIIERLDEIATKSNRSRNQLINMALRYALDNLKLEE